MEIEGKCPKCGKQIKIEEYPGNVVFIVDGKAARDCPRCGTILIYAEVVDIKPDINPAV